MPLHVQANPGDVAPIVFLPGDPDRATFIAENYLEDVVCYNKYRHLYGYTGTYKGVRVSIQTTGMGCPSAAIVANELVELGAKVLIRIGTSGIINRDVKPGDLVIATGSCPNDGTTQQMLKGAAFAPVASYNVVSACVDAARESDFKDKVHTGLIQSEDAFYATDQTHVSTLEERGVLTLEMEASAIFLIGNLKKVQKGCMCVASNYIADPEFIPSDLLANAVRRMATVALEAAVKMTERGQDNLATC